MKQRKILVLLNMFAVALLLSACEFSLASDITPPAGSSSSTQPIQAEQVSVGPTYPLVAPNPANGVLIYTEKCAPCHGETGMGNGPQAAQLPNPVPAIGRADVARAARPADWYAIITNGNLERYMPPFSSLSEGQRWDVIAYIISLSSTQEELTEGQALYTKNCAECHGDTGKGNGASADAMEANPISFANQEVMATRSASDLFVSIKNGMGEEMPAYDGVLSDDEIWQLTSYLRSLSFVISPKVDLSAESSPAPDVTAVASAETTPSEASSDDGVATEQTSVSGMVTGQLINNSGSPITHGVTVTLHGLDHMQVVYSTTTTLKDDGTFVFEGIEFPAERVYVATVDYEGATYGSEVAIVEEGQSVINLPITVFETTTDVSALVVDRLHVFFDFSRPEVVQVVQLYVISNLSDKTVVANETGGGVTPFTLPSDATNLQFQDGALGERYLETDDGFMDTTPVRPGQGQYQVMYAFDMPYDRKMDLVQKLNLPVSAMIIMTPADGVKLRSASLQDSGTRDVQGEVFQMYTGSSMEAGEMLEFSLSGMPGNTGMVDFMSTSTSSTGLVIGLGALGLVLVGAGVWLYRRNANDLKTLQEVEDEAFTDTENFEYDDPEIIMDSIIALDDLYAAGELPEDAYRQRRQELKERLISAQGE
jgi:mono/diheme cytochrome c family protein